MECKSMPRGYPKQGLDTTLIGRPKGKGATTKD